jgi:hypothetical protein
MRRAHQMGGAVPSPGENATAEWRHSFACNRQTMHSHRQIDASFVKRKAGVMLSASVRAY